MKININSTRKRLLFGVLPRINMDFCTIYYEKYPAAYPDYSSRTILTPRQKRHFINTVVQLQYIDIYNNLPPISDKIQDMLIMYVQPDTAILNTFIPRYVSLFYKIDPFTDYNNRVFKWLYLDNY